MEKKIRLSGYIKAAAAVSAAVLMLMYPSQTAAGTVNSINVCINSIIPSMFAFMALSSYVQSTGMYRIIFRPVLFILRHIIRADDGILSVFLLSLFGGYPVGVKLLGDVIAQNKNSPAIRETCGNAAMFCYCISPSFALIMIGNGVFGSTAAGAIIYISNVLSCLICGCVVSRSFRLESTAAVRSERSGLADAVGSAAHSMLTVCTVIIAFNVLLTCIVSQRHGDGSIAFTCIVRLFADLGILLPQMLLGALEISNLLGLSSPGVWEIPLTAAISSFGGVCVLMQCTAIANGRFPIMRFVIARIPCALLSAVICRIILQFTDISVSASAFSPEYTYSFSANLIIVPILMAMCIIIFNKSDKNIKKV